MAVEGDSERQRRLSKEGFEAEQVRRERRFGGESAETRLRAD